MKPVQRVATIFAALADLNRLRLLNLMRDGEVCVCYLHGALKTNQPRVSRHLAYLRRSGLVKAQRRGKWQYYRLARLPSPLQRILNTALDAASADPQFKKDRHRVKQICCSPTRFGLPEPTADE
jgi:ArsR family transcriptional regulator, arsenate/arsenite/antimonite-responsive transcriptional repressor